MSVVLHHGTAFVLTDQAGDFDGSDERGFYLEDVRCLSTLRCTLDGQPLVPLTVEQRQSTHCEHVASNPKLEGIDASTLAIHRRRSLGSSLREELGVENFGDRTARFVLRLDIEADFADIYAVKARTLAGRQSRDDATQATRTLPRSDGNAVLTLERTLKQTRCATTVSFNREPRVTDGGAAFDVTLARRQRWSLSIEVTAAIEHPDAMRSTRALGHGRGDTRRQALERSAPTIACDHPVLADAYRRAAHDLVELRLNSDENLDGEYAIAAGIPWYMALFGRDSLIASYQSLLHDPGLARGTLTALAHLQGSRVDPESEEQPGRILHEYRKHLRASVRRNIPKFPYYGSIDATPLFLVTLCEYVRCTGDLALAQALWPNVERAVDWIERFGDGDDDGLVEYRTRPGGFLVNEGWKDSVDSVRFADGRLARQPIALVEVQGYVVAAFTQLDDLYQRMGRPDEAARLRGRAEALRAAVERKYWLPHRRFYAEALDGEKRPVDALTSNPGHLLWTRAIPATRARQVADVLLGDEMFSGWGVRTMGAGEGGFNPISYHNGSIWPHDNVLLLQGLVRYGLHDHAARLASALLGVLAGAADHRFSELFAGFSRGDDPLPVAYPNANKPQAWASGAVLLLVRSILGLEVDALATTLTLRPTRLPGLGRLTLANVPVAGNRVTLDLSFESTGPRVDVDGLGSNWSVHVEAPTSLSPV